MNRELHSHLFYSEVWKNKPFSLHILVYRVGWEIIRGCL